MLGQAEKLKREHDSVGAVDGESRDTSVFPFTCAVTSVCDVDNADIECHLLVQNSCNISNSIIRTNALTSEACLQDPTFGTTTDLHDVQFIQSGVGHAIELATATTYNLKNIYAQRRKLL